MIWGADYCRGYSDVYTRRDLCCGGIVNGWRRWSDNIVNSNVAMENGKNVRNTTREISIL